VRLLEGWLSLQARDLGSLSFQKPARRVPDREVCARSALAVIESGTEKRYYYGYIGELITPKSGILHQVALLCSKQLVL
jgi:hypothetical protein